MEQEGQDLLLAVNGLAGTGAAAIVFDYANNKLMVRANGSWVGVTLS